jgi:hypothetical protein
MTRHYARILLAGCAAVSALSRRHAGLLNSGDQATLSATFTLSPAQTITSP